MARGQGKAITWQAHWPDSRIAVFFSSEVARRRGLHPGLLFLVTSVPEDAQPLLSTENINAI
jgi:hypothetical protein